MKDNYSWLDSLIGGLVTRETHKGSVNRIRYQTKLTIISQIEKEVESKNNAYWERNQLVGVLSRLYPSHLARHSEADKEWEDDWRNIVCVHTPVGQATWHIHDNDLPMFKHLKVDKDHWDGHTTEEKYQRLAKLDSQIEIEKLRARIEEVGRMNFEFTPYKEERTRQLQEKLKELMVDK